MRTASTCDIKIIAAVLIFQASACIAVERFTLSNEGLMLLNRENIWVLSPATVTAKRDVAGPGVEFDIYFPGVEIGDRFFNYVRKPQFHSESDPSIGTNVGRFETFELKFTLVAVNGVAEPNTGGKLFVAAIVGCSDGTSGYKPVSIGFGELQEPNAISSTVVQGSVLDTVGFYVYFMDPRGWDPNGFTVTVLVEPAPGAVQIPRKQGRKAMVSSGNCIYVDQSATGNNNGTNWANAYKYLQNALQEASAGDQIWVAGGTYMPDKGANISPGHPGASFKLKTGVALYGGFPKGGGSWEQGDPAVYRTILSGDLKGDDEEVSQASELLRSARAGRNCWHVVSALGTDSTAILDGFIVAGGYTVSGDLNSANGGGLFAKASSATISNCIFQGNVGEKGGAMYLWMGQPRIINCTFTGNAAKQYGGAIANFKASAKLVNCVFTKNWAKEKGGAIYNEKNKPSITNCTIADNYAYAGGGIYNEKNEPSLFNCIIWGNTSRYGTAEPAQVYGVKINSSHCCIQEMTEHFGGKGNISSVPRFADMQNGDFRLLAGSPCIDAGDSNTVPADVKADFEGNARICGSAVDIGAYESGG